MSLTITTAAAGVARTANYVVPTGQTQPIPTLLLEAQRTNLVLRSEEFSDVSWNKSVSVTANAITAPDASLTADLLVADGSVAFQNINRDVTFTGDGEKCIAIYLKAGTSASSRVELRDATAGLARHRIAVTWIGGVPTISTESGAGTLYPIESLGNGWYRISFSATGIVATPNVNSIRIYPTTFSFGTAGNVYAWGAQAENAVVPSSYIKTEGTTVTRNADSLYFPFTAPPQAMTIYARGVERGTRFESGAYIWQISQQNNNPRIHVNRTSGLARMQFQTVNTAGTFTTVERATSGDTALGDLVEYRSILSANGTLGLGTTLNNGTELVSTPVAGTALEAAWSGQRLWIGMSGGAVTGANVGLFAFTHLVLATGEQSRETMRQIAGVV
jgi:hypothetical protein